MHVLGVDPGKMTGLARWDDATGWMGSWQQPQQEAMAYCEELLTEFHLRGLTIIVFVERFTIDRRTLSKAKDAHYAIEQIGVLRYFCGKFGFEIELQQPGDAKRFAGNDKLAGVGWRNPTKGGHADDAARHVMQGLARHGQYVGPLPT